MKIQHVNHSKSENSPNKTEISQTAVVSSVDSRTVSRDLPVFLSARCVRKLTGLSESTIRRLRATDSFPSPIRLTPGAAGHLRWFENEILEWIESCRGR